MNNKSKKKIEMKWNERGRNEEWKKKPTVLNKHCKYSYTHSMQNDIEWMSSAWIKVNQV